MLFHSLDFFCFFIPVLLIYWQLSHQWQNRFLLLASYTFYGYWNWHLLGLLALSTSIDFFAARIAYHGRTLTYRRAALWTSVITNLSLLGLFKYYDFFITSFAKLFSIPDASYNQWLLNLVLPIGISFYTFQTMSYTIDCYRNRQKPTSNWIDMALYVAFFPQLIAGPIERARKLLTQLQKKRVYTNQLITSGVLIFFWGMMKKTFIGDNLSDPIEYFFNQPQSDWLNTLAMGLIFTFKVYFDYSGYSDMARGLSRCLGIRLSLNFKPFYVAKSATQFWSRWNITLTKWVRDYLFLPLSAILSSASPKNVNSKNSWSSRNSNSIAITISMLISFSAIGLWHGPKINFILFGLYSGMLLACHPIRKRFFPNQQRLASLLMIFHIPFSGVLFMASDGSRWTYTITQLQNRSIHWFQLKSLFFYSFYFIAFALVVELFMERKKDYNLFLNWHWSIQTFFLTILFSLSTFLSNSGIKPFIYFQF